jgi:hypothetical protein
MEGLSSSQRFFIWMSHQRFAQMALSTVFGIFLARSADLDVSEMA